MENKGRYEYWYLASPHMKDICNSLNELQEKYGNNFEIISVTLNHQNYIVLYKYLEISENLNDSIKDISNDIDKLLIRR